MILYLTECLKMFLIILINLGKSLCYKFLSISHKCPIVTNLHLTHIYTFHETREREYSQSVPPSQTCFLQWLLALTDRIDYSTLDQSLSIQKIWQNECGEESNLQINEHPDNNQLLQPIKTDSPCQPKDLQFENTSHSNLQCFMLFLSTNGGAQVEVGDSSAKIITDVVASPNVSLAD